MADHADRPLRALLADLAAPTPAPGGGSATAWAVALGAGLAAMTAGVSGRDADRARAVALQAEALGLAGAELVAYEPVLAALALDDDDPGRPGALQDALEGATSTPLAIVALAGETAELCRALAESGKPALRGDALAGADLADGARRAAQRLVDINEAAARELV